MNRIKNKIVFFALVTGMVSGAGQRGVQTGTIINPTGSQNVPITDERMARIFEERRRITDGEDPTVRTVEITPDLQQTGRDKHPTSPKKPINQEIILATDEGFEVGSSAANVRTPDRKFRVRSSYEDTPGSGSTEYGSSGPTSSSSYPGGTLSSGSGAWSESPDSGDSPAARELFSGEESPRFTPRDDDGVGSLLRWLIIPTIPEEGDDSEGSSVREGERKDGSTRTTPEASSSLSSGTSSDSGDLFTAASAGSNLSTAPANAPTGAVADGDRRRPGEGTEYVFLTTEADLADNDPEAAREINAEYGTIPAIPITNMDNGDLVVEVVPEIAQNPADNIQNFITGLPSFMECTRPMDAHIFEITFADAAADMYDLATNRL